MNGHHIFCNYATAGPPEECSLCKHLFKECPDVDASNVVEYIETRWPDNKIIDREFWVKGKG